MYVRKIFRFKHFKESYTVKNGSRFSRLGAVKSLTFFYSVIAFKIELGRAEMYFLERFWPP